MLSPIIDWLDTFMSWISTLSFRSIVNTYWFLFFIEFPRYYVIEFMVIAWRKLRRKQYIQSKEAMRYLLYREHPLVSILVPGKNEGRHIFKLVTSLKEQTYQNYELIVVDDGSDDNTKTICTDLHRAGFLDAYLRMETRAGKAGASNYGATMARGKYMILLDADSSLDRDAIEKILMPFYADAYVKAVGGCIKVRNYKETICTSLQAVEYLKRIQVGRIVSSELGIYHIISGAFGAFDSQVLKEVGYWDIGPGLDGDLTQKIRKAGYKVKFADDAICMTNAPTKWFNLYRQRKRWSRSLIRFRVRKHFDILKPDRNWSFLNWISNMENIMYDCVLNFLWVFYIINLVLTFNNNFFEVMFLGYFIRLCFSQLAFLLIMMVSERWREERFLYRFMPLMSPYTGYYLRIIRIIAHLQEIFFMSSYKDPWNPPKVSRYAQLEGI